MINRVLIRIKVIQILYSYLLVEEQFSLERMPESPTKEKRFAYSLYMDMLVLMLKVSESISKRGGDRPLADTRFIKRLNSDEQIKSLLAKYRMQPYPFEGFDDRIAEIVKESAIYKNFLKTRDGGEQGSEESVWRDIFNIIIYPDRGLNDAFTRRESFTLKGVERMREMMNKTFENFMASQDDGIDAAKSLATSLEKARELYFRLLLLPVQLTEMQERILDENRNKFLKTAEDINPNLRFVENALVEELRKSDMFLNYVGVNKLTWLPDEHIMMENLLKSILDSDIYKEYMSAPSTDLKQDCEFWRSVFKRVIFNHPLFLETLEDNSVYWNDDLDIMGTFVLKTIKRIEESDRNAILEKFKDDEDARFGFDLMKLVIRNKDMYRGYIDDALHQQSWDKDRLAFMDVLVIETAMAEILNFPKIPLTVSVNEYIEIAKSYSTNKSGMFVNGLLGSILKNLKEEGKLLK